MGIHKQLPLEKERPACHLTPIVKLDSPSTFPTFSSPSLSYLLAMCPCLTCFVPKSAPPCPRAWLRYDPLTHIFSPVPPVPSPSPNQGKFLFSFLFPFLSFLSSPQSSSTHIRFRPTVCKSFPFSYSSSSPHPPCHPTSERMQTSTNRACNCISVFVWPHFSPRKRKCDLTLQQIYHNKLPLMSPKQW